jgi:hypothetical protein
MKSKRRCSGPTAAPNSPDADLVFRGFFRGDGSEVHLDTFLLLPLVLEANQTLCLDGSCVYHTTACLLA